MMALKHFAFITQVLKSLRRKADQSDLRALIKGKEKKKETADGDSTSGGSTAGTPWDPEKSETAGSGGKRSTMPKPDHSVNDLRDIELRALGDSVNKLQQQLALVVSKNKEQDTGIDSVKVALKEKLNVKDTERAIATFIGGSGGAVKLGLPRTVDHLNQQQMHNDGTYNDVQCI